MNEKLSKLVAKSSRFIRRKPPRIHDYLMERVLLKDPHVTDIHYDEKWTLPEFDYSIFVEEKREKKKGYVRNLERLLNYPYIEDDFGSCHTISENKESRSEWKMKLEIKYPGFFSYYNNHDSLRKGYMTKFFSLFEVFERGYRDFNSEGDFEELTEEVYDMCRISNEEYDKKDNMRKIEYVREIKQKAYDVIVFLSKQSPSFPSFSQSQLPLPF